MAVRHIPANRVCSRVLLSLPCSLALRISPLWVVAAEGASFNLQATQPVLPCSLRLVNCSGTYEGLAGSGGGIQSAGNSVVAALCWSMDVTQWVVSSVVTLPESKDRLDRVHVWIEIYTHLFGKCPTSFVKRPSQNADAAWRLCSDEELQPLLCRRPRPAAPARLQHHHQPLCAAALRGSKGATEDPGVRRPRAGTTEPEASDAPGLPAVPFP